MNLYKMNPKLKRKDICVQGETLDKDAVVFGDKFAPFADPKTFPGWEPSLVQVGVKDLNKNQLAHLEEHRERFAIPDPPRHLGPITTANFETVKSGEVKKKAPPPPPKKEKVPSPDDKPAPAKLNEVFDNDELVDEFAGVTNSNVDKIVATFKTYEDLAEASNAKLRTCGVRGNFFSRVRDRAKEVVGELAENEE